MHPPQLEPGPGGYTHSPHIGQSQWRCAAGDPWGHPCCQPPTSRGALLPPHPSAWQLYCSPLSPTPRGSSAVRKHHVRE